MLPPSEQQGQVTGDAAELSHVVAGARDRERLRTVVVPDHDDLARRLADRIVAVVARATAERERCVLGRSEEHTSELQSPCNLVCRLLLEKKKKNKLTHNEQHSSTNASSSTHSSYI